ncbi:hypothetical protein [Streptococcus suis]|uniref:hypothetical protein n=1 Tax=Streptococcus suis TaxID=1307 RepID=UPI000424EB55|nr:hypothetical protein [Streptococcus suis]HEM3194561.1 hypothetical protein [Streptococcus suis 10581]MDG4509002.1 hypothetical protein [Streptococcus suis]HEL2195942.1 hypothetical protein [Streptococcus suis]HEL2201218.1 hypothetical protein [Streptococcus suis]HEM5084261.1 hypothetical protein [Streptococcus suis]
MVVQTDFEIFELDNQEAINEFHRKYYGGTSFNLTIKDIQTLMRGKSIGWTDANLEYSHVISLDDEAKTYLTNMVMENGNGD